MKLYMLLVLTTCGVAVGLSRDCSRLADRSVIGTTRVSTSVPPKVASSSVRSKAMKESNNSSIQNRKEALRSIFAAGTAGLLASTLSPSPSAAFDSTFPIELTDVDDRNKVVTIGQRSNSQQRKENAELTKIKMDQNLASFNLKNDFLPSLTWGLALFFASGSRSNPLATPLANVIYDGKEEKWLEDRNAGLFSPLPLPFLVLLGFVFLILGTITQYVFLQLAEGDSGVCAQLAGVALINGGFFEFGRIASGEKRMTRDEKDRAVQLNDEFNEFAENRLKEGGNCHRSDIVKSFRRYYAKYRQADSQEYPLTDLEIEKLLRFWNEKKNDGKAEMTSSGFYYGIQINTDADVFVAR
mmetsp:Transcript_24999/g.58995  ORF Transcript_24999/g.58995 Transcript_24999/m.58995 type:complete len:355 (+) Transcript_24999:127-1191(+)|eukprot:CAMPEP_0172392416 /NCGR_PEP_ID=MMETSP1061-20121228/8556_1 /TAXON_ID=37318 /ORGANISM="Pseudo-nitzschia pungens, Strain cf. pungens" /LENGTH=354 /DNA_ID=CAMNT_0013123257 /DNA_START=71 /DNA_END=1135 /DNA_ORIENTATION=-